MTSSLDTHYDHENDQRLHVVIVCTGTTASVLLHGEADVSSLVQLREALYDGELSSATSVDVNAAGLVFCDVASMRELALFARHARAQDRAVTTSGASPLLWKLARMMGVVEDLGLGLG
jgi:ABC-type transporter Mla MlaB component